MAQVEFQVPGPGTYIIEAAPSLPPLSQPGTAADVLTGEQFYGEDGNPVTGTMPDNPAEAVIIQGGGSYTIPKGYHTGKGTVTSEGTELPTLANPANAGEIISGKQSIGQNGETLTGTMPNNGAVSKDLTAGEKYIIPAGYHNGQGKVTAPTVASETPGTAEAVDILSGKTAWVNGEQITGSIPTKTAEDVTIQGASVSVPSGYYGPNIAKAIPTVEQTVPTISVSPEGLITAQAQQTEGFVAGGTKSATNQLPVQGAQTITPSTTAQTIQPNVYLTGAQTVQGDANLVPDNIKEAVSIFGVTGTYAGGGSTGDFAVPLTVTVESGATVTAVNGDTILTAMSVDGQAIFVLSSGGTWTITAIIGGQSTPQRQITVQSGYSIEVNLGPQKIEDVTPLNYGRYSLAAAKNSNFAIFAGGQSDANSVGTSAVDTYDSELSRSTPSIYLSEARRDLAGTGIGIYALFGGGYTTPSNVLDTVDVYDNYLTHTNATALSSARYGLSAAAGTQALFGGGNSTVDAYDDSLTRSSPQGLSSSRMYLSASNLGDIVLFGGGATSSVVDSYDGSLTRTILDSLSIARGYIASATVGEYVLFAGGLGDYSYSTVDVYDSTLTRLSSGVPRLSVARFLLAGTSLNGMALFGGGNISSRITSYSPSNVVDVFDSDLTRVLATELDAARYSLAATSVGSYILFSGGVNKSTAIQQQSSFTVDAYKI